MWDQNTLVHKLRFEDLERSYRDQMGRQKPSGKIGGLTKVVVTVAVFVAAVFVTGANFV
jgi:hypothetical protein